jgi:hypothetical protein
MLLSWRLAALLWRLDGAFALTGHQVDSYSANHDTRKYFPVKVKWQLHKQAVKYHSPPVSR